MANKGNPFKRAAGTKPAAGSGTYINDGDYDFLIERLIMRDGFKGDSFVAELRVERADQIHPDVKPNPVGSSVSWARVLSDDFNYQLMMSFMYEVGKATGDDLESMSPEQIEEFLETACGKENPCRGARISDRTYRTWTKGNAKLNKPPIEITAHKWRGELMDDEEIATNRAKLDQGE